MNPKHASLRGLSVHLTHVFPVGLNTCLRHAWPKENEASPMQVCLLQLGVLQSQQVLARCNPLGMERNNGIASQTKLANLLSMVSLHPGQQIGEIT